VLLYNTIPTNFPSFTKMHRVSSSLSNFALRYPTAHVSIFYANVGPATRTIRDLWDEALLTSIGKLVASWMVIIESPEEHYLTSTWLDINKVLQVVITTFIVICRRL
jgi:hypothetical protein